jgi:hypothetical protein
MNIGSILLTLLAINSLASAALFATRSDVFGTAIFLLAVPLFIHMAISENK